MIQFKIEFDEEIDKTLYYDFCNYLFKRFKKTVSTQVRKNYQKYKVREPFILQCSLIKWVRNKVPKTINLAYYVNNCLEMVKVYNTFIIRVNDRKRIRSSTTKVSLLIRILEYGTNKIPAFPLLRIIFQYYSEHYKEMFNDFMKDDVFSKLSQDNNTDNNKNN